MSHPRKHGTAPHSSCVPTPKTSAAALWGVRTVPAVAREQARQARHLQGPRDGGLDQLLLTTAERGVLSRGDGRGGSWAQDLPQQLEVHPKGPKHLQQYVKSSFNFGGVFFLGIFFIFFREFFSDSAFLLWLLFCFSASAALLLLLFFCFCCSFAFAAFLLLLLFRFCCSFAFAVFFAFVAFLLLLPFCFCCLFAFVALLLPCAFFVFCVLRALCALCAKAVGRLARLHALSWFHFLRARFFGFALRAFRLFHAGVKFREGCGHAKLTHPFVGKAGVKFREGCCHFNLTHPFCWQGEPPEGKI